MRSAECVVVNERKCNKIAENMSHGALQISFCVRSAECLVVNERKMQRKCRERVACALQISFCVRSAECVVVNERKFCKFVENFKYVSKFDTKSMLCALNYLINRKIVRCNSYLF
jgi:hypothetical protein